MVRESENRIHAKINQNFLIKWKPYGWKTGKWAKDYPNLTTARKWSVMIGTEEANRQFEQVLNGGEDVYIFKLRLTWEVKFVGR